MNEMLIDLLVMLGRAPISPALAAVPIGRGRGFGLLLGWIVRDGDV